MEDLKDILACLTKCGLDAELKTERVEPYVNVGDVKHVRNRMQFWSPPKSNEIHMFVGKEMGNWYRESGESVYLDKHYRYSDKENKVVFPNVKYALQFIKEMSQANTNQHNISASEIQEIPIESNNKSILSNKPLKEVITVDDDFRGKKIFEIINECFGKDYTGWMKAWYKIDDSNAAWFPRMEEAKINDNSSNALAGNRFINRISIDGTIIEEIDPARNKMHGLDTDISLEPTRLVFGRMKDGFHFFGVFKMDKLSKDDLDCFYRSYKRVGTKIDLNTMEYL